jgi:hypothetical protein
MSAGIQAVGQVVQGIGAYQAGKFNRKVERVNAINEERDGAAEIARIRDAARLALGRQVGAQAESGFEIGSGTALQSLLESQIEAEMDRQNIRRRAASSAANRRAQGELAYAAGVNARTQGFIGAAATVAKSAEYAAGKPG